MRKFRLSGAVASLAIVAGLTAACAPSPSGPASVNWSFKGTSVTVNNSQDEVCALVCVNTSDEPYLVQVAFRVKIGQAGSASAWVVDSRSATPADISAGQTVALTGAQQAAATFSGVQALDVLDLANNKLEVFGTYTWAVEEDSLGVTSGANSVAGLLADSLNATLANATLPSDANQIVNLIIGNIGNAFTLLLNNIPTAGLGDDTLGGGLYLGIGATGVLGGILDSSIGTATIPAINLLGDNKIPPKIVGGGLYTLTGGKTFTTTFNGAGGEHKYVLASGKAA